MDRAVSPALGVVVLVAVTLVLAATVGAALSMPDPREPTTVGLFSSVDADEKTVVLDHRGGDTLEVTELEVRIAVDGERLAHQPPIPFFAADGFASGPTGPFNSKSDGTWHAGESASLELAGTNAPRLTEGSTVTVTVVYRDAVVHETSVEAR
jgi:flagellin-like protein